MDTVNAQGYDGVNNGVYKIGFATRLVAYDDAFEALFATLDMLEDAICGA